MWNLSALAQKAKEAAARIESQLDDSVGIKDDSGFGLGGLGFGTSSTSNGAGDVSGVAHGTHGVHGAHGGTDTNGVASSSFSALSAAHEAHELHEDLNINEEDDFFSNSHEDNHVASQNLQHQKQQQQQQMDQMGWEEEEDYDIETEPMKQTPQTEQTELSSNSMQQHQPQLASPVATRMEVSADEGDDFFGEEDDSIAKKEEGEPPSENVVKEEQDVLEEKDDVSNVVDDVNDNGNYDVSGDGDGWEEGEDIPLDEDEDEVSEEVQLEPLEQPDIESDLGHTTMPDQQTDEVVDQESMVESPQIQDGHDTSDSNTADGIVPLTPADHANEAIAPELEDGAPLNDKTSQIQDNAPEKDLEGDVDYNDLKNDHVPADTDLGNEPSFQQVEPANLLDSSAHQEASMIHSTTSPPQPPQLSPADDAEKKQLLETIDQLTAQLLQREDQLTSKSQQLTSLTLQNDAETAKLRNIITETKEEAKKRILRAKERVEEMQTKLTEAVRRADASDQAVRRANALHAAAGDSSKEQSQIIAELRAEGEQLARKQSQMEQSVRNARGEARELMEQLEMEREGREEALGKVESLERELKSIKEELTAARKGESHSKKLEGELVSAKEESERQRALNLGLEQQLKEMKEENKSLKKEVQDAKMGAALESERESNKLKKERDDMLSDLENKLRTSEREANVREDALRHEVSELRKRWQDAVRRAEDLNMDIQHSTAPLLRQLESTERQNRARASAWAELETKLRSDLEDHVIQLEKATKEKNDLRVSEKRLQRLLKEKEEELISSHETIDVLSATIETLEAKVEDLEEEGKKMKEEWVKVERQASEGVAKVRNDMMKTVVDSEERYQSKIRELEEDLEGERQKRFDLETQLDVLAESAKSASLLQNDENGRETTSSKEKSLGAKTNQASILHDTLIGLDDDDDDNEGGGDDEIDEAHGYGSFAAMEQLSLTLKGAKIELEALRKQLATSEETREALLEELGETRQAAEKLPLFEEKVSELSMEVKLKDMEIQGLRDDIADVRFLYRTQLDKLLEEKTATPAPLTLEGNENDESAPHGVDS